MVDVNNFVKLLCYIFEKGKLYREICLEIRSETLAFLLFSLFTGGVTRTRATGQRNTRN